jgi:hypothetical protein
MEEMMGEYKYRNNLGGGDFGDKKEVFVVFFLLFAQILDFGKRTHNY